MRVNLKIFILLFVLSIVVILIILNNYFKILNFSKEVEIEGFISNKSWNVNLKKEVYYKSGDILEYLFLLRNDSKNTKGFDLDDKFLTDKLNLKNLKIDTDSFYLSGNSSKVVKISGEVKKSGKSEFNDDSLYREGFDFFKPDDNLDSTDKNKEAEKISSNNENENIPIDSEETNSINYSGISFTNDTYYSSIDNLVVLTGNSVDNIERVGIGDNIYEIEEDNNNFYFIVKEGDIINGQYFVFGYDKNNKLISFENPVNFIGKEGTVDLFNLVPKKIENNYYRWLTIQGKGFSDIMSVQLSNNSIFKNTDYNVISDNVITVKIPANMNTGTYYINIMTLSGIFEFPDYKFEIIEKVE